jgi:hypothetical protein
LAATIVKAKARWRAAKYKVAYLCPKLDAAGVGWILMTMVNDLSDDFAVHHILGEKSQLTMGIDYQLDDCLQVLKECDIVHINNEFPDFNDHIFEIIKDKPMIIHMHAGVAQWDHKRLKWWKDQGVQILTCTPGHDLMSWVPNFIPISKNDRVLNQITHSWWYFPSAKEKNKLRLICHHNYLAGKGIIELRQAIQYMDERYYGGRLDQIMDWKVSESKIPLLKYLTLKRDFDVCYDTITHGYCGMATWESMAQGNAVICRIDEAARKCYEEFFGSVPPIMNPRNIEDVIQFLFHLLEDRSLAQKMGQINRQWMFDNYNVEKILEHYEDIYLKAVHDRVQQGKSFVPFGQISRPERFRTTLSCPRSGRSFRLL